MLTHGKILFEPFDQIVSALQYQYHYQSWNFVRFPNNNKYPVKDNLSLDGFKICVIINVHIMESNLSL